MTFLTTWITLPNHFFWLPLPLGVVKIRSNWPHWHVRILSGQANNKQNLSKIDYLIISQLLISYHHSDVMYKKFHPTAQMLSCSKIVLSSNFDPSNFLLFHGKIWVCTDLSFFKTLINSQVNHFSGFYLIEDYLKDIRSKFHATVTPQSRVMTLFFKHDYSAHTPSSSVTLMSRFKSVTVTPLWNWWWKFG